MWDSNVENTDFVKIWISKYTPYFAANWFTHTRPKLNRRWSEGVHELLYSIFFVDVLISSIIRIDIIRNAQIPLILLFQDLKST